MIPWKDPDKETPELNGLTSEPIIYVVDDKVQVGHYHMNGCFYSDLRDSDSKTWLSRAYNKRMYTSLIDPTPRKAAICRWWAYLKEVPPPPTE